MRLVVLQPSYLPWLGYFDQMYKSDLFILYDDAQYDKHGWRNRNRIKTAQRGAFVMIDIILQEPDHSFLHRQFMKLERGLYVRRPDQYRAIVERHFRVRRVDQDRGHVLSLPQNSLYNDFVILECGT